MKQKTAEIWLYGEIGSYWLDTISAKNFSEEIKKAKDAETITVHVNSPGGDVFEGIAIYNMLRSHKATVDVEIEGLAASIASIISLSGDTVRMAENAFFMIHNPWTAVFGEAKDLREAADKLDLVRDVLVQTYAKKTGGKATKEQIGAWMDAETWFTGKEAHANGFVDELTNTLDMAALVKFDFSRSKFIKNAPKTFPGSDEIVSLCSDQDKRARARIAHMTMWSQKFKTASAIAA
ncbi:MAG: Clp protease ClpP [Desulfovibrio sp.]|nr:Clp protease ClpP [Desulfovibrio sp.]